MVNRETLQLYAVTDRAWEGRFTLLEQVEQALKGGVTIVQFRDKNPDKEVFLWEALKIKELCKQYQVPFIINDHVELALEVGASGVHVGLEDTPVCQIRKKVPKDFIIGATAKSVEQAVEAERQGADYLGVGAIFPSPTKKDAKATSVEEMGRICDAVKIPVVAIGGLTKDNLSVLEGTPISGVALISAIFGAKDIEKEVMLLKKKVGEMLCRQ